MSNTSQAGLSRRSFLRTLGAASVAAGSFPAFAAVQGVKPPQVGGGPTSFDMGARVDVPDEMVVISGNENPLGPSTAALDCDLRYG